MKDTAPNETSTLLKVTTEKLPFDQIPNQTRLFLDYLANPLALKKFYPAAVNSIDELSERVPEVLSKYTTDRNKLADALSALNARWSASTQTFESIERLRQADCLAVVTGQQAGIFTGALYKIYKVL